MITLSFFALHSKLSIKAHIGQLRVYALNEVISQTKDEKETIITLFCPKIATLNVQI